MRLEHEHVVRHCCCCCCCCCYETLQGSEVGGKRSRGGAMASSFWKVCGFTGHTKWEGCVFGFFHPETPFSKKCVLRRCVFSIRVDGRPKQCFTCAFSQKSVFVWTASQTLSVACFPLWLSHADSSLSTLWSRISQRWNEPEFVHQPLSVRKASNVSRQLFVPLCYASSVSSFYFVSPSLSQLTHMYTEWHIQVISWVTCWRLMINDLAMTSHAWTLCDINFEEIVSTILALFPYDHHLGFLPLSLAHTHTHTHTHTHRMLLCKCCLSSSWWTLADYRIIDLISLLTINSITLYRAVFCRYVVHIFGGKSWLWWSMLGLISLNVSLI